MEKSNCYCPGDCIPIDWYNFSQYYLEIDETLKKLVFLLQNEFSYPFSGRQLQLLDKYFNFCPQAHLVYTLSTSTSLLELLPLKIRENDTFKVYFEHFLELCFTPPLLLNSSELINCEKDLEEYFSILGGLLFYITEEKQRCLILDALINLLCRKCPLPRCFISLKMLRDAAANSRLPQIMSRFLSFVPEDVYEKFLTIIKALSETSNDACQQIVLGGAVESLLIRMEPTWRERAFIKRPPNPNLDSQLIHYESSNAILWTLLKSLRGLTGEEKKKLGTIKTFALWSLKYVFQYFCLRKLKKIDRNNVIALLLEIIMDFDHIEFLKSGLVEDIIALNYVGEMEIKDTVYKDLEITACNEDFIFLKLLLFFLPVLSRDQYYGCRKYLQDSKLIGSKLKLFNRNQVIRWHPEHHNSLVALTSYCVFYILPINLEIFLAQKGILKSIAVFHDPNYDPKVVLAVIKSMIVARNCCDKIKRRILTNRLIDVKAYSEIKDCMDKILAKPRFDFTNQMIVAHFFHLLEKILQDKHTLTNSRLLNISIEVLRKVLNPHKEDIINPEVPINVLFCLWDILLCDELNLKQFFYNEGVYLVLDIALEYVWPVKVVALGLLSELAEEPCSIPFFITWRGKNNQRIVPFLLELFRTANEMMGVKHSPGGKILDPELPLMGKDQWLETYSENSDLEASPAISDMIGSTRSKVYAILQMLTFVHEEEVKKSNEIYKMFNQELELKDKVTLVVAINYFALKLGEVWNELDLYFQRSTIRPIASDYEILSIVLKRAQKWGIHIQQSQQELFKNEKEKEIINENLFYANLHESKLGESLEAYQELDYIARCTKQLFRVKSKRKEKLHLYGNLEQYDKDPNILYHMTYMYDINVNPVFDQILYIVSSGHMGRNFSQSRTDQVMLLSQPTKRKSVEEEIITAEEGDSLYGSLNP